MFFFFIKKSNYQLRREKNLDESIDSFPSCFDDKHNDNSHNQNEEINNHDSKVNFFLYLDFLLKQS